MIENWITIIIGWPAIVLAVVLAMFAIAKNKPLLLIITALLLAPITIYLAGSPRFNWMAAAIPLFLLATGFAVRRRRSIMAWCLFAPIALGFAWLSILVMNE